MSQDYSKEYCREKSRQYVDDGFCVVEQVLSAEDLAMVRTSCLDHLAGVSKEHRAKQVSTGSLIDISQIPGMAELVTHSGALDVYRRMGFTDVRFSTGYLISKPAKSPPLFWHFDWMGWDDPISYQKGPLQTFFMYYLVDTTIENGCLKVIPRSHLEEHELHTMLRDAHTEDLSQAKDLNAPEFISHPDEENVCVKAGDLVIGDSRILHASHPNNGEHERPVITIWMHPNFSTMPEGIQAFTSNLGGYDSWSLESQDLLEPMKPSYVGDAIPTKRSRLRKAVEK
jgi:hypothetical protein